MKRRPALNLVQLWLDRLPGVATPFSVPARPGVNLISGPNEIGKSSTARAVFQLLWPETAVTPPLSIRGEFTDALGPIQANRLDAAPVGWTRHGEPAAAPAVAGGHLARCYELGLLDLHRPAGDNEVDRELALEIRKQMAGGFDLDRAREVFPDRTALLRRRRKEWVRADQERQQCLIAQQHLARQEDGLVAKEEARSRAVLAARRVERLEAALAHAAAVERVADLTAELATLPDHVDRVQPGDDKTLAALTARLRGHESRVAELEAAIARRDARLAELAVGGDLKELTQVVEQAELQAVQVDASSRALAAAEKACDEARGELAPELLVDAGAAASAPALRRLLQAHRQRVRCQLQLEILEGLRTVEEPAIAESAATSAATAAVTELLGSGRLRRPGPLPGVAGALTLALAILGWLSDVGAGGNAPAGGLYNGSLSALALTGCGLLAFWWRARRDQDRARRHLEDLAQAAGRPLPARWRSQDAPRIFLERAREVGAEDGARRERARLRGELEGRIDAAQAARDAAQTAHRELLRELDQDPHRETADLLHEMDAVARYRAASEQLAAARGTHDHESVRQQQLLAQAQQQLRALGVTTAATRIAVRADLDRMRERLSESRGLQEARDADALSLQRTLEERDNARSDYGEFCRRLGLASDTAAAPTAATARSRVATLVAAHDLYQTLQQQLAGARRDRDRLVASLAEPGAEVDSLDPLALSPSARESRLAEERAVAAGRDELNDAIVRIRERVALARRRDDLGRAQAEAAERAADLAEALAAQRDNLLGRFLVDQVARRHEDDTQPPLLAGMNAYLAAFTAGRYGLVVSGHDPVRFVAVDNTGQRIELAALSDGTRSQLLLAARLAFLTEAESGLQAPLFLDEALTASDPARFDAIAVAVGRMAAATGRQVFYLTSNPADLAAWQRALAAGGLPTAHLIDLAERRGLADAAPAVALSALPRSDIPDPGAMSPGDYGRLLRVPTLHPWQHENSLCLFYLWPDELELVQRLWIGGLTTLGPWRRLGRQLVTGGLVSEVEAARIEARGQVAGAFLDAWRIGRGRPLTRADLVASDILSDRMLGPAGELLATSGGDAEAFMDAVNGGRVKRLQQAKKEALQDFLERQGHLDSRPVLSPDQVVARVLGALGPALAAGTLHAEEVRRLVLSLHRTAAADSAVARNNSA